MKCICCDKKISLLHSDKLEEDILFIETLLYLKVSLIYIFVKTA